MTIIDLVKQSHHSQMSGYTYVCTYCMVNGAMYIPASEGDNNVIQVPIQRTVNSS